MILVPHGDEVHQYKSGATELCQIMTSSLTDMPDCSVANILKEVINESGVFELQGTVNYVNQRIKDTSVDFWRSRDVLMLIHVLYTHYDRFINLMMRNNVLPNIFERLGRCAKTGNTPGVLQFNRWLSYSCNGWYVWEVVDAPEHNVINLRKSTMFPANLLQKTDILFSGYGTQDTTSG